MDDPPLASTLTGQATEIDNPDDILATVTQDALTWIGSQSYFELPDKIQKKLATDYLAHYFSPWKDTHLLNTPDEIKEQTQNTIDKLLKSPGFAANGRLHSKTWVEKIAANADLSTFPNLSKKAITIHDADVRLLPTLEPTFTEWLSKNNGYPFDNLQNSLIAANTPIAVLHVSRDGAWYLIFSGACSGWIKSQDIAFVNRSYIKTWETHEYFAPSKSYLAAFVHTDLPPLNARIGNLYPIQHRLVKSYDIPIAVSNSNHRAVTKLLHVEKQQLNLFPLKLTLHNIALVANELLGNPYGWGGIYGFRDCSSTLMDLMAPFGIWLPRNSGEQCRIGQVINLADMADAEKESYIIHNAIPFLTLIHLPGHIALYIGAENNQAYLLHAVWHFGGTVITPLNLKKKTSASLLTQVDSMTNLVDRDKLNYKKKVTIRP
ncbi:MAG TPA: SH3 domain-containing protein [Gammaproteobacteria bacterium]|nr:SH3 domain-containing protein [Gammaproteobacteria bacterium]